MEVSPRFAFLLRNLEVIVRCATNSCKIGVVEQGKLVEHAPGIWQWWTRSGNDDRIKSAQSVNSAISETIEYVSLLLKSIDLNRVFSVRNSGLTDEESQQFEKVFQDASHAVDLLAAAVLSTETINKKVYSSSVTELTMLKPSYESRIASFRQRLGEFRAQKDRHAVQSPLARSSPMTIGAAGPDRGKGCEGQSPLALGGGVPSATYAAVVGRQPPAPAAAVAAPSSAAEGAMATNKKKRKLDHGNA